MAEHLVDEQSVFEAARRIDSRDERDRCLDRMCCEDTDLRKRVAVLLRAYDESQSFLESPPPEMDSLLHPGVDTPALERSIVDAPGTVIGPYKLLEQIGEGGMGVVFMAQQSEPVERRVALKIIRPGMDSRQVIARFEAERQALAVMDHPNIAKVIDAGTTDSGRPYFVMELVKGIPITQSCDQHKLSVRERLELFVPVCQAIQHAHQKGIIHRDIKPSNVLVARYDERPVPKIIDFGVAKATQQKLTEKTAFTQFGQIVGTFEYMSPEQAQFNQLDIDTRSDVYSLGVLLYELLTGQTPFDGERLRRAALDELLRIIREEDPLRPSLRLSTSETQPETAANRHVEPKRLSSLLRGELDWIVMKALEKDRSRRYESATALADDIERYLNDEPVTACPPSSIYLIGKFTRRHKTWLSTAAVVLVTTLVGLTVATVLIARERDAAEASAQRAKDSARREAIAAEEANRERQRAEENLRQSRDAVDRLFTRVAEELANKPHMEQIRRELLEDALEFYQGFLKQKSDDPAIRFETASAHRRVGEINKSLGRIGEAVEAYREATRLLENLQNDFRANDLAHELLTAGEHQQAADHYRQAFAWFEQLADDYPDVAKRQEHFAHALLACPAKPFRDPQKSRTVGQRALQLSPENATLWSLLGGAQTGTGDYAEAIVSFHTAAQIHGSELPVDARLRLALAYWQSGDHERGRELHDQVTAELPNNPYAYPRDMETNVLLAEVAETMGIPADRKADPSEKASTPQPSRDAQDTPAIEQDERQLSSAEPNRPASNDESETGSEK